MKNKLNLNMTNLNKIKILAKKKCNFKKWNWLENGTEKEITLKKNLEIYSRTVITPRFLTNNSSDTTTKLFGKTIPFPLIVSPVGHLTQFHKDGEGELARGVENYNGIYTVSNMSRLSLNEIRSMAPKVNLIFQLYICGNKKWVNEQLKNAYTNKVLAICVTVDVPTKSYKYRTLNDEYDARKFGRRSNFTKYDWSYNQNLSWDDLLWLRKKVKIPLIIKGIMHPDDAIKAAKIGFDAIWISNHGGRAFDGGISSLEALINIKKKLKNKINIFFDGGIRSGTDILKAKIHGADIVGIGRPAVYGLIAGGKLGVYETLKLFYNEYKSSIILSGIKIKK
tara:strand:- start:2469 stop:3479 length:1011 start_codon:yes stop_codon:yes gene_type:complete